jgi:predicted O-methyltransferase YrrM
VLDWSGLSDEDVFEAVASEENRAHVLRVMDSLAPDPNWTGVIKGLIVDRKIETRCFMSWLANELRPASYLEIGVRRGFTMAMVVSRVPRVRAFGIDMWKEAYAGSENPGPSFVASEIAKFGPERAPTFLSGNSHDVLPVFLGTASGGLIRARKLRAARKARPEAFELILVDGDHSLLGAYADLAATLPRLAVGGVLVFDDVAPDPAHVDPEAMKCELGPDPHGWVDLMGVFKAVMRGFPSYRVIEYTANTPGVTMAVRLP